MPPQTAIHPVAQPSSDARPLFGPARGTLRSIASVLLGSIWLALATLVPVPAKAADTDRLSMVAIEFYHPGLDHYFVTASPLEISALTSGQFSGWVPTGYSFPVLAPDHTMAGSTPVCRFYGNPSAGLDSHFYSASPKECGEVRTKFPEAWLLESENVFRVFPADAQTGACPADTEEVRRLYNRRADANHRYTDKDDVALSMLPKGYVPEGYGPSVLPTAFCVPKADENVTCTAAASERQPVIGTAITLTANCSGNPVAYQWTGCTSSGGNTCTATSSSTGARAYVVTASTGTATSRPAIASVVWQPSRANPAPPATSIACTLAASNLSPVVGEKVTLNATCTGTPTRYTWNGCTGTGSTCTATAGAPGAVTYSVSASNGTFNSVTTPIIVTWKAATAFACAVAASNPSPQVNTSVTLTAKCSGGTPTAFAWTGCASTTSTCSTASANPGARTYAVSVTSASGATAPASTSVNWQAAPAPTPSPTPSAVACTVNPSTVAPVVNTPLTLTATCSGAPTSYAWTGCASTTSTCNTTSTSTGSATYSVVARNASSTSPAASSTVNWVAVPPVPAGMPTSADFLARTGDPRGGSNGYNTLKRLPDGRAVSFGGFSHDPRGNNAVVVYSPTINRWQITVPHTPWVDGPMVGSAMDVRERTYLWQS